MCTKTCSTSEVLYSADKEQQRNMEIAMLTS